MVTNPRHYDPDSGQWDGQLPNPEIAVRAGPITNPTIGRPLDAKEPTHWAEHTGPWLKMAARAVLREIARYADPTTGEAFPSEQTLANTLGTTVRTIRTAVKTLVHAGLLTIVHRPSRSNIYRLIGVDREWAPANKDNPGQLPLEDYRLKRERQLLDEVAAWKREVAKLTGGVLPEPVPEESSGEEKKKNSPEDFSGIDISSSIVPVTESEITAAFERFPDWPKGFTKPASAMPYFLKNPEAFRVQLKDRQRMATDTTPTSRPLPILEQPCDDCGQPSPVSRLGPSLTDANSRTCGACWRDQAEAHFGTDLDGMGTARGDRRFGRAAVLPATRH